jgi:hypothetical protein
MTGKWLTYLTLAVTLLITPAQLLGQDITVTSELNKNSAPVGDRILLTVTVSGADANRASEPQLDPMPLFTVSRAGTSKSIEIINFKTSATISYTYILIPQQPGTFNVGGVHFSAGGKGFSAAPVSITVYAADQQPPDDADRSAASTGDENIFITGAVDRREVYVGEQITYTLELYNRLTTSDVEYEPPSTTGFWAVDLPKVPASLKLYQNRQYNYNVLKTALFPATSGTLTIGPASITFVPRMSFFSSSPAQKLSTKPVTVTVKSLPESGKPSNFSGAVGTYQISAKVEQDTVHVGDVIAIRLSVNGEGNIDLISSVDAPDLSSFRTYDPRVLETIHNSGFTVGGSKMWEYVVIPRQQGRVVVQPFSLTYFDTHEKQYRTVTTDPIELFILPGSGGSTAAGSSGSPQTGFTPVASDIRYLKPDKTVLGSQTGSFWLYLLSFLAYLVPAGIFAGSFLFRKHLDRIEGDTGLRRKLTAWKTAQKRLGHASEHLAKNDTAKFCGALHECLTGYIGDMTNNNVGASTTGDLEHILRARGISADDAVKVRKTLEMCDFIRFASIGTAQDTHQSLLAETADHLTRLREVL